MEALRTCLGRGPDWLDPLHLVGITAAALVLTALAAGLVLLLRFSPRRQGWARERRLRVRKLHVYGGLAAVALALVHHVAQLIQTGELHWLREPGESAGLALVILLACGLVRWRPPRAWIRKIRLVRWAHTVTWLAAIVLIGWHSWQEHLLVGPGAKFPTVAQALPVQEGQVWLTLEPGLNLGGQVRVTQIATARLLDARGRRVRAARVTDNTAVFRVEELPPGYYFIRINNLAGDPVPVHLTDPHARTEIRVGTTLQLATADLPTGRAYLVRTWSAGQDAKPVVGYSDGEAAGPRRYAYSIVLLDAKPPRVETRVLGSAELLTSLPLGEAHPVDTWVVGPKDHGRET